MTTLDPLEGHLPPQVIHQLISHRSTKRLFSPMFQSGSTSTLVNRRQRGPGAFSYQSNQTHQPPFMLMIGVFYRPLYFLFGQPQFGVPPGLQSQQHLNPTQFLQQYQIPYPPAQQQFLVPLQQQQQFHHPADSYRPTLLNLNANNPAIPDLNKTTNEGVGHLQGRLKFPTFPMGWLMWILV
ncbi:hypothetical protein PTTG_11265 [Puccinia triticina 1-1 BBBD Race 1]|uniref:Uncharacterized protein n=1 Tax=Puccinia triticina (isolate 1-1 / race 1 (BBBD)) TaxID=630390 RepID=A0A0C4FDG0_PUCT1|nr:hypothetical protein PTTG_11265 [Puccinia triticina 1-1 BBBD Race 1]